MPSPPARPYGFAFEPLSNGSTTVTVTAPGALTMTSTGVRPVTVTTPAISVTDDCDHRWRD